MDNVIHAPTPPASWHDTLSKCLVGYPLFAEDALRHLFPDLGYELGMDRPVSAADVVVLSQEYLKAHGGEDLGRRYGDQTYLIQDNVAGNGPPLALVVMEIQSTFQSLMAIRMLEYQALAAYFARAQEAWPFRGRQPDVPLVPCLLHTGERPWPGTNLWVPTGNGVWRPRHTLPVIDVADWYALPSEDLANPKIDTLVELFAHLWILRGRSWSLWPVRREHDMTAVTAALTAIHDCTNKIVERILATVPPRDPFRVCQTRLTDFFNLALIPMWQGILPDRHIPRLQSLEDWYMMENVAAEALEILEATRQNTLALGEARGEARGRALGEARGEALGEARGKVTGALGERVKTLLAFAEQFGVLQDDDYRAYLESVALERLPPPLLFLEFLRGHPPEADILPYLDGGWDTSL